MSSSSTAPLVNGRHCLHETAGREEMLACLAQALGGLEIDRDELADALLGHGHPKKPVHAGHGDGIVRDDHEAGIR